VVPILIFIIIFFVFFIQYLKHFKHEGSSTHYFVLTYKIEKFSSPPRFKLTA